jgi:hypothetical protein
MATKAQKENQARFKAVQAEAKKLKAKNPKLAHTAAVKQAWAILYAKSGKTKAPAKKAAPKKKIGAVKKKAPARKNVRYKGYVIETYGSDYKVYLPNYVRFFVDDRITEMKKAVDKDIKLEKQRFGKVGKVKAKAPVKKKAVAKKKVAPKSMHKDTQSHNVSIRVISGFKVDVSKKLHNVIQEIEQRENVIHSIILRKMELINKHGKQWYVDTLKQAKGYVSELKKHKTELKKLI